VIVETIAADPAEPSQEMMAELLDNLDAEGLTERPLGVVVAPVLALLAGQQERADRLFGEALAHPDPWVRAMVPLARAQIAENNGDVEGTRSNLQTALAAFRDVGDRWAYGIALMSWGTLRTVEGELADARRTLEEARRLFADLNEGNDQMMLLLRLADVRAREGDFEGALELCERSRRQGAPGGEQAAISLAAAARLEARTDPGRIPALREELATALDELQGHDTPGRTHGRAMMHNALAALALEDGDEAGAHEHLVAGYGAAVESRDVPILAGVGVTAAAALAHASRPRDAAEVLGTAARLRGAEDATSLDVATLSAALRGELGDDAFAEAYARGRGLAHDAAVVRLDPASLGAPVVGP
jgi:ATP/maltotriose-dependent transcriptional regulator MalT